LELHGPEKKLILVSIVLLLLLVKPLLPLFSLALLHLDMTSQPLHLEPETLLHLEITDYQELKSVMHMSDIMFSLKLPLFLEDPSHTHALPLSPPPPVPQ